MDKSLILGLFFILFVLSLICHYGKTGRYSIESFNTVSRVENLKLSRVGDDENAIRIDFDRPIVDSNAQLKYYILVKNEKGQEIKLITSDSPSVSSNDSSNDSSNNQNNNVLQDDCNPCVYTLRNLASGTYTIGVMVLMGGQTSRIVESSILLGQGGNQQGSQQGSQQGRNQGGNQEGNQDYSYSADGSYNVIRREIGGYPDNLTVSLQTTPDSLSSLVQRQLSLGIIDANVHVAN